MIKRRIEAPPEHLYPSDEWRVVEARYAPEYYARAETAFSLANGYVGIRGTFEEGRPAVSPGTFINGFHETWPIVHGEEAFGLARTGQTIVNVPDATIVRLYVDDEPLFLPTAHIHGYERVLDMRAGTLARTLAWATPAGRDVHVRSRRFVSFEHRHLIAIEYEVELRNGHAPVMISSEVVNRQDAERRDDVAQAAGFGDPRAATALKHRVLQRDIAEADDARLRLGYHTANSGMTLAVAVDHVITTSAPHAARTRVHSDGGKLVLTADAVAGVPIRIVKYIAYQTSRSVPAAELAERCDHTLDRALREGFEGLLDAQRAQLDEFWERADVRIDAGDLSARTQQAIRWNLFQLAQATWRAEGTGVPAKGLTGHAYEGHYFWDTEVYVLPFLAYTQPRVARNLLRFRHSQLPHARRRATELSQRGALFPWRTINGEEASAYYQAGTAQYHLNADIAFAIRRYVRTCGDVGILAEIGAEILIETARFWEDLGFYADDGEFHIHGVTGPDEYTTVVNDNTYTNLMARANLLFAAEVVRQLATDSPDTYAVLADQVGLRPDELDAWDRAAHAMHIPYDDRRGIHPQDASFLDREVWDLENTPADHFPLLLHYHPLVIYRHQVIKQADIVLAMYALGNEFSPEQKRANFEYYDALTTGDSSLSASLQCIVAAEIQDEQRAYEYFRFALLMDLADVAGNASDGVHIASAAGVWQALVFGFGGVRDYDGELSFSPCLPRTWNGLEFSMRFNDRVVRVHLTHDREHYAIAEGGDLEVAVRNERVVLSRERPFVIEPAIL